MIKISIYIYILNKVISKFNNLKSESNFRVAICISGLYRNHINSLESIRKYIVEPLNADVFVHTWDQKSVWTGIGGYSHYTRLLGNDSVLKSIIPKEIHNLKNMENILPNIFSAIKNPVYVKWEGDEINKILSPKKIIIESQLKFEANAQCSKDYITRGSLNQIKMFYGMKKSFDLALESNQYDYIIRIRPDILVENKIELNQIYNLQNNIIYTSSGDVGLQEMEFICSSSMIKNLSDFIGKMFTFKKLSLYPDFPLYDAHNIIFSWMVENNYALGKDQINRKILTMDKGITLKGLETAIDSDLKILFKSDKEKFLPFIQYLKENYC